MDGHDTLPHLRQGTYSIVARDPDTGEVGVAVQSHWFSVGSIVSWARPGVGAVATAVIGGPAYGPGLLDLLAEGVEPSKALARLTSEDQRAAFRQVAVVDAAGRVAVHTGESCIAFAGDRTGDGYSVQANMMASPAVWPAMAEAFEASEGPLARRLLVALPAAQAGGGGARGRPAATRAGASRRRSSSRRPRGSRGGSASTCASRTIPSRSTRSSGCSTWPRPTSSPTAPTPSPARAATRRPPGSIGARPTSRRAATSCCSGPAWRRPRAATWTPPCAACARRSRSSPDGRSSSGASSPTSRRARRPSARRCATAAERRPSGDERSQRSTIPPRLFGRTTNVACGSAGALGTLPDVARMPHTSRRLAAVPTSASAPASPRLRTLIVDDSETVRDGLSLLLETLPSCELVGAVGDADAALELTRTMRPHLVLQDFSMPGVDTLGLMRALAECRPQPAILVLSAFADGPSALKAMAAGACGWVLKDAEPEELFAAVLGAAGLGAADAPAERDDAPRSVPGAPAAPAAVPALAPPAPRQDLEVTTPLDARTLWALLRALESDPAGLPVEALASRAVVTVPGAARYVRRISSRHPALVAASGMAAERRRYTITAAGRRELARLGGRP